ncbi:MAG: hydroxyethylthiazole kinase [Desulfobacterales bacterium]|nr:hydroxyethylthiazole kinase [Desulfobacterales bacterium]
MSNLNTIASVNLEKIREKQPLIHNITNFVVMNFTANVLLSMGASPVMAHAANEVEEMAGFAGALVLNIGTLTDEWIESMILAGKKASGMKTPVILDPVGAGATALRTDSAKLIIDEINISAIRGNASEILSLRYKDSKTKGVDAVHSVEDATETALILARELDTTLAITGPSDLVTDGDRVIRVQNGHPLMGRVTGTGCAATAVIGAFLSVDEDPVSATATALSFFGLAGEIAAKRASAPGSFMISLIDALYEITPEMLQDGCKFLID